MSLEMRNRLPVDAIQVEGTEVGSVTRELAKGQEGVIATVDKYLGEKKRVKLDETRSEIGIKKKLLELGQETVKTLQSIGEKLSRRAKAHLAKLERDLKIVDDDDDTDVHVKIYLWQRLGAMNNSERFQAVHKAFADGNTPVIRAVLDWEASLNEPFDPKLIAEWKSEFAKGRDPAKASEFATLESDIEKLRFEVEQAILNVSKDSGIGDGTLADRMSKANAAIIESQIRRTESTEDQLSGKNVRSPHAPNTPVTA